MVTFPKLRSKIMLHFFRTKQPYCFYLFIECLFILPRKFFSKRLRLPAPDCGHSGVFFQIKESTVPFGWCNVLGWFGPKSWVGSLSACTHRIQRKAQCRLRSVHYFVAVRPGGHWSFGQQQWPFAIRTGLGAFFRTAPRPGSSEWAHKSLMALVNY